MSEDVFSLDKFKTRQRWATDPATTKKPRRPRREFVQISRQQLAILRRDKATAAMWNVFAELIWQTWDRHKLAAGKPIKFTNHSLPEMNISHDSRGRAIRGLEGLGLIKIDRASPRKSPVLTVLEI